MTEAASLNAARAASSQPSCACRRPSIEYVFQAASGAWNSCNIPIAAFNWRDQTPDGSATLKTRRPRQMANNPVAQRMRAELATEAGRALYRMRQAIVEPVIGYIKEMRGFRRFALRGLSKVCAEWRIICTCPIRIKVATQAMNKEIADAPPHISSQEFLANGSPADAACRCASLRCYCRIDRSDDSAHGESGRRLDRHQGVEHIPSSKATAVGAFLKELGQPMIPGQSGSLNI